MNINLIDHMATHDAESIRRLVSSGETLNTVAAQFGYTPSEAHVLLHHTGPILLGWWEVLL